MDNLLRRDFLRQSAMAGMAAAGFAAASRGADAKPSRVRVGTDRHLPCACRRQDGRAAAA